MILNSKTFLTAAAVLTAVRVLGADPAPLVYEQYVLDDGTILNGYTVTALPDNRTVFHTENAVRFLDADSAAQRFNLDDLTNARWLKDLDNKWLAFTLNYPDQVELLTPGGDPGMKVRLVATNDHLDPEGPLVAILERPVDGPVKYLSIRERNDTIADSKIRSIRHFSDRNKDGQGLDDVLVLEDGTELVGTIISEIPGTSITISADGLVHTLAEDKYVQRGFRKKDPENPFIAQSPLLSVIKLVDGGNIAGVLKNFDYGKQLITIVPELGGSEITIPFDNYGSRTTRRNEAYPPKARRPLPYDGGQLYWNSQVLPSYKANKSSKYTVKSSEMRKAARVDGGTDVKVTTIQPDAGNIFLYKLDFVDMGMGSGEPMASATLAELAMQGVMANPEGTDSKTGANVYTFPADIQPGNYILSLTGSHRYYLLSVTYAKSDKKPKE